ncbi:cupin domain-containing protein [Pseudomonas juntendi]|uniref:cupin domain-containing protein n=1 Tax=Pseudomonas TaxID=286 RepID=UPI001282F806|nr:cupin domain-containing protein [Pseudomonas putida]EAN8120826.1 cupin domain-containing protein [Salmonella enterica]MEB3901637.1 cupin domain-containing protein [Pseudomonas putida]
MPRTARLALAASILLTGCTSPSIGPNGAETEVLLRTTSAWDGTPYEAYPKGQPELALLRISIPANTALDWHCHTAPNVGFVMAGELVVETQNGKQRTLKAGDALAEIVGGIHRGFTEEQPAQLLVFYASAPGVPDATPAPLCPEQI